MFWWYAACARFDIVIPASGGRIYKVRSLRDRVAIMKKMHEAGLLDPDVRGAALLAVRGCPDRDEECEIRSIFDLVKQKVRYTGDIQGHDTFASASRTLEWAGGDCDDVSVACATLLRHLGFRVGVRAAATGGTDWDHIYAIVGYPKDRPRGYVALDTTVPHSFPGWEPVASRTQDFIW